MSETPSPNKEYIVTLVHGTYAPRAEWASDPNSRLRRKVKEELESKGFTVKFEELTWGGENSDQDRLDGASKLRMHIQCTLEDSPNTRHILIGHSHGGNVILRALDGGPEIADKIYGVVTLATPFINCERRDLDSLFRKLRSGTVILLTALAVYTVGMFNSMYSSSMQVETSHMIALGAVLLIWLIGIPYLWFKVFAKSGTLFSKAEDTQGSLMEKFDRPGKVDRPFLSMAVEFDEAGIGLRLGTKLARSVLWLVRVLKPLRYLVWLVIIGFAYLTITAENYSMNQKSLGFVTMVLVFLQLALAALFTTAWGGGVAFFGLIRRLAFGSGGPINNALVKFTTTKKPTGVKNNFHRDYKIDRSGLNIRHSLIYETNAVVTDLAEWMIDPEADVPNHK